MKYILLIAAVLAIQGCKTSSEKTMDSVVKSTYAVKQISRGNNQPKVDIRADSMHIFLVALHHGLTVNLIAQKLGWNEQTTKSNIDLLILNKLLKKRDDKLIPALGIFPLEMGNLLAEKSYSVAQEIADSIKNKIPYFETLHNKTEISQKHSFHDLSLLYLSNVLLDVGQINNMERDFLGSRRPMRNGSRYYLAIFEKEQGSLLEPYGIYGNQVLHTNDSSVISVYGNKRTEANKGWRNYEDKVIHSFGKSDFSIVVNDMPESFLPTLVYILNKHRGFFEKEYATLRFDEETTFEEFFIWWYHIIYTQTTDLLISEGHIKKPVTGLFYYEMKMK